MADPAAPIGVFDSGVGGLTVVRQLMARLPRESIVYFGDTARVPYGTKSPRTVIRYAESCTRILIERGVKLLVVACNTASSCALDALRGQYDVPVIGVIEPGARAAVKATRTGAIGVAGTAATIASGAYPKAIAAIAPHLNVLCQACPLLVPLAEEGWTDGDVPHAVAQRYLAPMLAWNMDTLVLGCTHYPLLKKTIAAVTGANVSLVDSAEETAAEVETLLDQHRLHALENAERHAQFLVSDGPAAFAAIGERFLGFPLESVEWVDF